MGATTAAAVWQAAYLPAAYLQTLTEAADGVFAAPPNEAYFFAAVSGALAVAATLTAAALFRRHQLGQAARRRLEARIAADLTAERVFLVAGDRLTPASPATDGFSREMSLEAGGASGLERIFAPSTARALAPLLDALCDEGAEFEMDGWDAAAGAWRLVGQVLGARAVLRMLPSDVIAAAGAEAPAPADAPREAGAAPARGLTEALETAPVGAAVFDADGRLAGANAAARRMLALEESFVAGAPGLRAVLDALRRAGRAPEPERYADWRAAALEDPVATLGAEPIWTLPNGEALRVETRPLADGFALFVDDPTDTLALERRYAVALGARRATIDALDQGVAVVGRKGGVQIMNAAFARLWRLEADAEKTGPPRAQAGDGRDGTDPAGGESRGARPIGDVAAAAAAADPAARAPWERIVEALRLDGGPRAEDRFDVALAEARHLAVRVTPLPDGAALIACVDESDARRAHAALMEKNATLEAVDRLKTAFLNDISYHLRTPLNAVIGYATMLRQEFAGPLSPPQEGYVDNVLAASDELRALIADALDLGALSVGDAKLQTAPISLGRVVEAAAPTLEERAARLGVTLSLAPFPPAERLTVAADAERLEQALSSAASALLTSASRGDQMRLALAVSEPEGAAPPTGEGRVVLQLALVRAAGTGEDGGHPGGQDGGGGERAEAARARPQVAEVGALPLSLAERIAALHGGRLTARETPEAARIYIALPNARPPGAASGVEETRRPGDGAADAAAPRGRAAP